MLPSLLDLFQRPSLLLLDRSGISGIYLLTQSFGYGILLPFMNDYNIIFSIGPFHKIHNFESRKGEETHKGFSPLLVSWDTFQSYSWRAEGKKHLHFSFKSYSFCLDCTIDQGGKEVGED